MALDTGTRLGQYRLARRGFAVLLAAGAIACSEPPAPSAPTPTSGGPFAGTWTGVLTGGASGDAGLRLVLSQNGSDVTGTLAVLLADNGGSVTGTINATVNLSPAVLSFRCGAGLGAFTVAVTGEQMTGDYWSIGCGGLPAGGSVTLSR
jgi:hypothetical protein